MFVAIEGIADDSDATGQQLLTLAEKHFKKNDLWPAEIALFRNRGTVDCTPFPSNSISPINRYSEGTNDTNTDHADSWSANRTIRADRLTWLCADSDALKLVSDNGIQITNARIISDLGKTNTIYFDKACFPLRMDGSVIESDVVKWRAGQQLFDRSGSMATAGLGIRKSHDSRHCHFHARLDMQIFGNAPHNHAQVARRRDWLKLACNET
jgi:hypothetical protein